MAATTERNVVITGERPPALIDTLAASQVILAGTVAMNDSGKAKKYVAGTAGALLLGIAPQTYTETTGADYVAPQGSRFLFKRGNVPLKISGANPVTRAYIGKKVRLDDEDTVSNQAIGANDLGVVLRRIDDGLAYCDVE